MLLSPQNSLVSTERRLASLSVLLVLAVARVLVVPIFGFAGETHWRFDRLKPVSGIGSIVWL